MKTRIRPNKNFNNPINKVKLKKYRPRKQKRVLTRTGLDKKHWRQE